MESMGSKSYDQKNLPAVPTTMGKSNKIGLSRSLMSIIWPIFGPIWPIFWADAESLESDLTALKPEWFNSTEVGRPVFALTTVRVTVMLVT